MLVILGIALGGLAVYAWIVRRANKLLAKACAQGTIDNNHLRYLLNLQAKMLGHRDALIDQRDELLERSRVALAAADVALGQMIQAVLAMDDTVQDESEGASS